jgi:hypothetical protein
MQEKSKNSVRKKRIRRKNVENRGKSHTEQTYRGKSFRTLKINKEQQQEVGQQ